MQKVTKKRAIKVANALGFDIVDLAVVDDVECVGKQGDNGVVYWPIDVEGSGFTQLFKGFSRWVE
jgi:hypothetical protein